VPAVLRSARRVGGAAFSAATLHILGGVTLPSWGRFGGLNQVDQPPCTPARGSARYGRTYAPTRPDPLAWRRCDAAADPASFPERFTQAPLRLVGSASRSPSRSGLLADRRDAETVRDAEQAAHSARLHGQ
jgi:hypothetical protein